MMNTQRVALITSVLCGTAVLSGWVIAGLAGFGSARIENAAGALPIVDRRAPALVSEAERASAPQASSEIRGRAGPGPPAADPAGSYLPGALRARVARRAVRGDQ